MNTCGMHALCPGHIMVPYSVTVPDNMVTALGKENSSWGNPEGSAVSVEIIPLEHGLNFQL